MPLTQVQPGMLASDSQYTGFKNRIINGAMVLFQRGTAATSDQTYSVDRWRFDKGNDATESVSQNADAPVGFNYSLRNTISTGDATIGATQFSSVQQAIEGYNIADLGWGTANAKTVTLSFWIRSSVTGQYTGDIRNSNDTKIFPYNFTINTANTWEQKTVTIPGCPDGTWNTTNGIGMQVAIYAALGSNYTGGTNGAWGASPNYGCGTPVNAIASNGNIFAITGVQLEVGSTATSFDTRSYGTELGLCQRYYCKSYQQSVAPATSTTLGVTGVIAATTSLLIGGFTTWPVTMRTTPTVTIYSQIGTAGKLTTGGSDTGTSVISETPSEKGAVGINSSGGFTVGGWYYGHFVATAEL